MNSTLYTLSSFDMEAIADHVKVVVIDAMMREGILSYEDAEEWCEQHTVLRRKKSIFRTLTDKWLKFKEEKDTNYWIVVKQVIDAEGVPK